MVAGDLSGQRVMVQKKQRSDPAFSQGPTKLDAHMGTGEWQQKRSAGSTSGMGWICQEPGIAVGMEALPHWVEF